MKKTYEGEEDCGRRFDPGTGFQGCRCQHHEGRRKAAEDYERQLALPPAGRTRHNTIAVRLLRARRHGGTTMCECGAGPFRNAKTLKIHEGKMHK